MSDAATEIAAQSLSLDRALVANDAEAVARCFTGDGVLGESGVADITGREAIRDFLAAANTRRKVTHHRLSRDELVVLGDRAIELGRFEETKVWPDKPPVNEWGRVVTFWRREADGAWRIERLVVSDLPGPA